jgi:hypothetical protein
MNEAAQGRTVGAQRAGVTLLELLLVMGLVGLVLGAGLGALTSGGERESVAPSVVRSALRAVQGAAALERAPASLVIDPEARTIATEVPRTLGSWQFEPAEAGSRRVRGAEPILGSLAGAEWVAPAWIGTGIDLARNGGRASYSLPLHLYPEFEFERGLGLTLAVHPERALDGRIADLGGIAGIEYRRDGGLEAWIQLAAEDDPRGARLGGRIETVLPPRSVPVGRWTVIELLFDGVELRVVVGGFPVSIVSVPGSPRLPALRGPLVLGDPRGAFPGQLDGLVLRAWQRGEPIDLGQATDWPAGAPTRVRFDADGTLDARLHPDPLSLTFEPAPGRSTEVRVSRYGTVE